MIAREIWFAYNEKYGVLDFLKKPIESERFESFD